MKSKSNFLLLLASFIWGSAFVAQRVGMDHIGPYTFNFVRFALGSISLLPVILFYKRDLFIPEPKKSLLKYSLYSGTVTGIILFGGISFQQIGLLYTTVGKAAFISCLYIVLVPILGVFMHQRIPLNNWLGSAAAITGLYLLCIKDSFSISYGDLLELAGTAFWTMHLLWIARVSKKSDTLIMAFCQFLTCSILSGLTAMCLETIAFTNILSAAIPLLYGGVCSSGIAYTLQIEGQKNSSPSQAAIILSMETVFAVLGGYLFLNEILGPRELLGCSCILGGIILAQLRRK